MIFNKHSALAGHHAFLSASKYHWVHYSEDKIARSYEVHKAAQRGTDLHALASEMIRLGVRLEDNAQTLNQYVNDALGFRMMPEQTLFVSINCFGTPDAISFRNNMLRVHDLKTGITQTSFLQLEVYCAMFCMEYKYRPHDIDMELRIYQNDAVRVEVGDPDKIAHIIDRIKVADEILNEMRKEESL